MLDDSTFEYLLPTEQQRADMDAARKAAKRYADILDVLLPEGADKTYVLRQGSRGPLCGATSPSRATLMDHRKDTADGDLDLLHAGVLRRRVRNDGAGGLKPILLIDGDEKLFKATVSVEKEIRWDKDNHVLTSNSVEAMDNLKGMLGRLFERFGTQDHALCFSTDAGTGFRLTVDPTYKSNRKEQRKPLCYSRLRKQVESEFNCVSMHGLEADDVMGILATKPGKQQRIIISQDKDMKTIPATLWDGQDLINVSEAEADYFHLYQTLIGDTSDGYKGCPGIGPKKAEKLLAEVADAKSPEDERYNRWLNIIVAYEKAGLTEADALTQARLARILRWSDWDAKAKKPILWEPK